MNRELLGWAGVIFTARLVEQRAADRRPCTMFLLTFYFNQKAHHILKFYPSGYPKPSSSIWFAFATFVSEAFIKDSTF